MPHFSNPTNVRFGPRIMVQVFLSLNEVHYRLKGKPFTDENASAAGLPKPMEAVALVDTGASCTCVTPQVAQQLRLTPVSVEEIHTPAGISEARAYAIGLIIPHNDAHKLFPNLRVMEADLAAQGIDLLIGRDVLADCLMVYNGATEQFTLAF